MKGMSLDIKKLVNPRTLNLPEYDQIHVTICWQNAGIQRLMSNESSYVPLESVQKAIRDFSSKVNWYPEDGNYALKLRTQLAGYTDTKMDNITIGNGSMELLDLLFQTFITRPGEDQILIPAPDYTAYTNRVKLFGYIPQFATCGENVEKAAGEILNKLNPDTKLILFSRPNNPVGKITPKKDILHLLESGVLTIVDEAYVELADPGTSVAALVSQWDNLIVLRSFSKGFGLAGLRLGYVLAHPDVIKYINKVRHIFNVNLLAIVAAEALMDDIKNAQRNIDEIRATRDWLEKSLAVLPGFRVIPSRANFLLVDVGASNKKAGVFVDYLYENGFFVRDFSKGAGLDKDRYFRITIGYRKDMQRLLDALIEFETISNHSAS